MKKQSEDSQVNQEEQTQESEQEQEKEEERCDKLKTKMLPPVIMLLGGAVSSIVTYVRGFSFQEMLVIVCVSLFLFYFLGLILKRVFDSFRIEKKEEEESAVSGEGEVIEKTPEGEAVQENADKNK